MKTNNKERKKGYANRISKQIPTQPPPNHTLLLFISLSLPKIHPTIKDLEPPHFFGTIIWKYGLFLGKENCLTINHSHAPKCTPRSQPLSPLFLMAT